MSSIGLSFTLLCAVILDLRGEFGNRCKKSLRNGPSLTAILDFMG